MPHPPLPTREIQYPQLADRKLRLRKALPSMAIQGADLTCIASSPKHQLLFKTSTGNWEHSRGLQTATYSSECLARTGCSLRERLALISSPFSHSSHTQLQNGAGRDFCKLSLACSSLSPAPLLMETFFPWAEGGGGGTGGRARVKKPNTNN